MSQITELLGNQIRSIRKCREISIEQLALRAQINQSYMGQIERGKKSPTVETLDKIVIALGVTFEELFSFERTKIDSDSGYTGKILHQLDGRDEIEKEGVYKVVKTFLDVLDKKK